MSTQPSSDPVFNIKAVSERTGIPPVTLRAWERRHGFPNPQRTDSGYRLYSEQDIAALNWLKMQTESGLSIGRAVRLLLALRERGEDPAPAPFNGQSRPAAAGESIEEIRERLIEKLLALDDRGAGSLLRIAFSIYPLDAVLLEIISPVMHEVGERWHRGEISVATEHFASQQCRLYLMNALEALHQQARRGTIVAACAPGEWHEIGLIMVAILLRLRGWNVIYLGANTSLERLGETIAGLEPNMLLFSATTRAAGENLTGLNQVLADIPDPKPVIGLGGQAFQTEPTLVNRVPGTMLGGRADQAVEQIERMLDHIKK